MNESMGRLITDFMKREEQNRQALSMLLEQQRDKARHHLAFQTRMGVTTSYITSVSLDWIFQYVHFAGDLPIFKGRVDEKSKKVLIDENTVDEIQQRQPDWRRQLPMTFYLATRKNHKFPPLLVVGYQNWVFDKNAEEWGIDSRAMRNSLTVTPMEPRGVYCDLDDTSTNFYALDGQHRLMAILGLKELLTKGQLFALDSNGRPKRKPIVTRDDVIQYIHKESSEDEGEIHSRLETLMFERIGIEIIPAVTTGESYREALFRLRRIFVDVNENAKKLTRGEIAQLDESNGFRVTARRLMVSHLLLKGRVDQKATQLSESSENYTTLQSLVEITKNYLKPRAEFAKWDTPMFGDRSLGYMRPDETELGIGASALDSYFEALMTLPSHIRFGQGKKAQEIRDEDGEDNILFRPMVQSALAEAVAILERDEAMPLESIMRELARQEDLDQLKLRDPSAPWFGVLCDPVDKRMRRQGRYRDLCVRLFCYLLGGGIADDEERARLRGDFAGARRVGDDESVNMEGERVSVDDVLLPNPWR